MALSHNALALFAAALTLAGFIPYIISILRGQTRPHLYSWLIWAIATLVVGAAQWADGGGVGAWVTLFSGALTCGIVLLTWLRFDPSHIRPVDALFLIIAACALPAWAITDNPLTAVVMLTLVDIAGFGPTFRKSYHAPFGENLVLFYLVCVRNLVAAAALEHYSLTTLLFPLVIALANGVFIGLIHWRRFCLPMRVS
ncbi:MAG TPA: hypothetical protein VIC26_02380 [Marinagarivorans sp.]